MTIMASNQAGKGISLFLVVLFRVTLGIMRVSLTAMRFSWCGITLGVTTV